MHRKRKRYKMVVREDKRNGENKRHGQTIEGRMKRSKQKEQAMGQQG